MKIILVPIWLLAVINRSIGTDDRRVTTDLSSAEGRLSSDLEERSTLEYLDEGHNETNNDESVPEKRNRTIDQVSTSYEKIDNLKTTKVGCITVECEPKAVTEEENDSKQEVSSKLKQAKLSTGFQKNNGIGFRELNYIDRNSMLEARNMLKSKVYRIMCTHLRGRMTPHRFQICKKIICDIVMSKNERSSPTCSELARPQTKRPRRSVNDNRQNTIKDADLANDAIANDRKGISQDIVTGNLNTKDQSPMIEEVSIICRGSECSQKSVRTQNFESTTKTCPPSCDPPGLESKASQGDLMQTDQISSRNFSFKNANTFYQEISETRIVKHGACPIWCKYPEDISQLNTCLSLGCKLVDSNKETFKPTSSEKTNFGTRLCSEFCHPPISYSVALLCESNHCTTRGYEQDLFFNVFSESQDMCPGWCQYPEDFSQIKMCLSIGCKLVGSNTDTLISVSPAKTAFVSRFCSEFCHPPLSDSIAVKCNANGCNIGGHSQIDFFKDISETRECPQWCRYSEDVLKLKICLSFGCKLVSSNMPPSPENTAIGSRFCLESCRPPIPDTIAILCAVNHCNLEGPEPEVLDKKFSECTKFCEDAKDILDPKLCIAYGCNEEQSGSQAVLDADTLLSQEQTFLGNQFCLESCHSPASYSVALLCKANRCSKVGNERDLFLNDISDNQVICSKWCKYPEGVLRLKMCLSLGCKLVGSETDILMPLKQEQTFLGNRFCLENCHPPATYSLALLCNTNRCTMGGPSQEAFYKDISETQECPKWCEYPGDVLEIMICLSFGCKLSGSKRKIGMTQGSENTAFGSRFCLESCRPPVPDPLAILCVNHCNVEGPTPEVLNHKFSECPKFCKDTKDRSERLLCAEYGCDEEQRGSNEVLDEKSENIIECPHTCENVKDELILIQCMLIGCSNKDPSK